MVTRCVQSRPAVAEHRRSLDDDGGDGKSKECKGVEEHGELRRLIKK